LLFRADGVDGAQADSSDGEVKAGNKADQESKPYGKQG